MVPSEHLAAFEKSGYSCVISRETEVKMQKGVYVEKALSGQKTDPKDGQKKPSSLEEALSSVTKERAQKAMEEFKETECSDIDHLYVC
jgi:hypothetical protein